MSINKNIIALGVGSLFLIASIAYSVAMKKSYEENLKETKTQISAIKSVAALQKLWSAKGEIRKLNSILKVIPNSKKVGINIKRSKATLNFVNLTDRELNKILTKLAMQPLRFKKLKISRNGEKYSMECLCVW